MGCSQRTGHCMCDLYMHLSHSCQTVSLPYALMSTGKINHPLQWGGRGGDKKKQKNKLSAKGPSTYQQQTFAAMSAVHLVQYNDTTAWLQHTVSDEKHTPLHIRIHKC